MLIINVIIKKYRKMLFNRIRLKCQKIKYFGDLLAALKKVATRLYYKTRYSLIKPKTELDKAKYQWSRCTSNYPYAWINDYRNGSYTVYTDQNNDLGYVHHNGKRLYFSRHQKEYVAWVYSTLLIEQDIRSAHRYIDNYSDLKGKTLLDIGCAEAIFALDVIEYVDHVYLFECEENWIEALEATFAPWRDKVTIIRKLVTDISDDGSISIDDFIEEYNLNNIYLKMDIEGYETQALNGARNVFSSMNKLSGAICIYHRADDKDNIKKYLEQYNCETTIVPGYLYFGGEFRSAIIRFNK